MIAVSNSATLLKAPRRMRCSVISAKKRSTRLSQDAEVGVKWRWKRGCAAKPPSDLGGLVGGVVVEDQVQVEIGRRFLVDSLQKAQEFAMPMARHAVADDHAGEHVEGREQRGGAVAFVVVGHAARPPLLHLYRFRPDRTVVRFGRASPSL